VIGNGHRVHIARVHVVAVTNVVLKDVPVADTGVGPLLDFREAAATTEPWDRTVRVAERDQPTSAPNRPKQNPHEGATVDRCAVDRPGTQPHCCRLRQRPVVVGGKAHRCELVSPPQVQPKDQQKMADPIPVPVLKEASPPHTSRGYQTCHLGFIIPRAVLIAGMS